jgi:hypothetical protein
VNRLVAGGPDSKVTSMMDNNSPAILGRVRSYYRASLLLEVNIYNMQNDLQACGY